MQQALVLYRCGWEATPPNEDIYSHRHPPIPNIMQYWHTGSGGMGVTAFDTYVGLVVAPAGTDPIDMVRLEFLNVVDRGMTTVYNPTAETSDRFSIPGMDWNAQRLAYFLATGQLYTGPIVGLYELMPDTVWWCTTNIELFDL